MKDKEIEIQVKVENTQPLKEFLKANANFIGEKRQVDEYYTPAHRDFTAVRPIKEWIRLREANGDYSVTYKNWHYAPKGQSLDYCDEYETAVEDGEAFRKIINALDFRFLTKVDKVRRIWRYKDYEIDLDSVADLGDFVEVEYKGDGKYESPENIAKDLVFFLKSFGGGRLEKNSDGYPFLLMFPKEAKYEEI